MLTGIELKNYRGHAHTVVPLTRFTLVVGDNAVGKTSVLESVNVVTSAIHGAKNSAQKPLDWDLLQRSGATEDTELTLRGDDGAPWDFHMILPLPRSVAKPWRYRASGGGGASEGEGNDFARRDVDPSLPAQYWTRVPLLLRFDARRAATPSYSEDAIPTLSDDGYGLATVLKELKANDDVLFGQLVKAARSVIPSLQELRFQRVVDRREVSRVMQIDGQRVTVPEETKVVVDEILLRFSGTDWLPARAASEGTLLTLAILAMVHTQSAPRVVLLDDIDRGLHPRAQGELVAVLRRVLDYLPDLQFLATSHSPYIVDSFEPESVVVLGRPDGDAVVARPLSEHPDARLRAALTTGEFLTASGSGWYWP